ncbi:MAG: PHB depolymerase family esterase [Bdellovibrionales bacterium]|nr:PHB depolymerase family esterase [Bdellovibrionales bacterium]
MLSKLLILVLCTFPATAYPQALPQLNIDQNGITVSGISSGAYMSTQLHVAYSQTFSGSASIAGGVYWCAQGETLKAQIDCAGIKKQQAPLKQIEQAKTYQSLNEIDALENLSNDIVYVFASTKDYIIHPSNSDRLIQFMQNFIPSSQIIKDYVQSTAHGFPTLNYGSSCSAGGSPWLLNCQMDTAGTLLEKLYAQLLPRGSFVAENLIPFSQSAFGNSSTPLYSTGWIYVPTACRAGASCRLHVALHGCQMSPSDIQDQFVKHAGYNEWAESNNIVVLYPQSDKIAQKNPYGCWDWFGFTGANYATKSGAQMKAIKSMIDQVSNFRSQ